MSKGDGARDTMSFADGILTENLAPLRQKLLYHPLWTGIEDGTLDWKRLGLFFEHVEPLAGCMALTTYFYWMLAYGFPGEKLAAVSASEDIFIQICARVGPALMRNYGLSAEQVQFFTVHDEIDTRVNLIDTMIITRYTSEKERQRIIRAVRLSHEFELMFYDTIMNTPL